MVPNTPTCGETLPPPGPPPPDHPTAPAAGAGAGAAAAGPSIHCWCCSSQIHVPAEAAGNLQTWFKCGWCGALTEPPNAHQQQRPGSLFRQVMLLLSSFKVGVPIAVVLLTLSITVPGALVVLPHTSASALLLTINHIITWILCANILFNFYASVRLSPGTVRDDYHPPLLVKGDVIPRNAYNNIRHCQLCQYYKPFNAHHCRICGTCVVDMDHHCPFINNCVGPSNLRNYILFLMWTIAAMSFCVLQAAIIFVLQRDVVFESLGKAYHMVSTPLHLGFLWPILFLSSPWRMVVAGHMMTSALGVGAGVGSLLALQLSQLSTQEYQLVAPPPTPPGGGEQEGAAAPPPPAVSALQHGLPRSLRRLSARLRQIVGARAADWVWPRWGPNSAALTARKQR